MAYRMEESIHSAVRSGDITRVNDVLNRIPSCVNDLNADFSSPLHLIYDHVNPHDGNNQADDRLPIIKLLIDHGANVNIRDINYETPLHLAIEKYQINGVKMLLENNADHNIRGIFNSTALIMAVFFGIRYRKDDKIIKILLDYQADPNLTGLSDETALDNAIQFPRWDYVKILLKHGARVKNVYNTFIKKFYITDIFALPNDQYSILIDFLLSHANQIAKRGRFSISNLGNHYEEPLRSNSDYGRIFSLLESLRMRGVRINNGKLGDTYLHEVVRKKKITKLKALLREEETNVNVKNFRFETPLHLMMVMKNDNNLKKIFRLLLDAGADWRALNLLDETPFLLAVKNKKYSFVKLMLSRIARVDDTALECSFDNTALECSFDNIITGGFYYTENNAALHELLVAISIDCEIVIDRLLDEDYIIDEVKKCCQDVTIALTTAIDLNKHNLVKKLLEAGFRANGKFSSYWSNLMSPTEDNIGILCLLREFHDETALIRLMFNITKKHPMNSDPDDSINLIIFYNVINQYVKQFNSDLTMLRELFKWKNITTAEFDKCEDNLLQMRNTNFSRITSGFDIMTMNFDSLVKLLNNKKMHHVCEKKVRELRSTAGLEYYQIALRYRLELALEKNNVMNAATYYLDDISGKYLTRTRLTRLPNEISWDILSQFDMRDLKKLANIEL